MTIPSVQRYRDPDYTGENRCLPCTIVNVAIAVVLVVAVVSVGVVTNLPLAGGLAGFVVWIASVASIYCKGYLVPGTPALTKRYLPPWVLALFGKAGDDVAVSSTHAPPGAETDRAPDEEIDLEAVLTDAGALEPCQGGSDLCLSEPFRREWLDEIDRVRDTDAGRDRLPALLNTPSGDVTVEAHGDAFRARVDGDYVGTWESRGAFRADIAAAEVLPRWLDEWETLPVDHRGQLLNGLRLFLPICPDCGGDLSLRTETVESCCTSHDVAAVACEACSARVFESDAIA